MYMADALNTFALMTLIFLGIRMVQTHVATDSTLGSALAFIYH